MALHAVAGWKIYIGGTKADQTADFTASDFSAESWSEIDGWSQSGGFGDTAALITSSLINRGRDIKQKGTNNAGQMQNVFAWIPGDTGQDALIAAAAADDNYAFKIEANDASSASGSAPTTFYFIALVMNANFAGGGANTIQNMNSTLELNSNLVTVDAT